MIFNSMKKELNYSLLLFGKFDRRSSVRGEKCDVRRGPTSFAGVFEPGLVPELQKWPRNDLSDVKINRWGCRHPQPLPAGCRSASVLRHQIGSWNERNLLRGFSRENPGAKATKPNTSDTTR